MRKHLFFASAGLMIFLFASCCKNSTSSSDPKEQQHPISIAAPVANSITAFSFSFFKSLQSDPQLKSNVFVSPLSLHIALGMLVNGASDETKEQILKVLGAESISLSDLNESYKKLMNELPKADTKVNIGLANSIWYRNNFTPQADFANTMKNDFRAQISGLSFLPSDVNIINKWASDHTNGRIKNVIQELSPQLLLLMMNALYFKGDWTEKFDIKNTSGRPFRINNGIEKTVKMMHRTGAVDYASMQDFEAVQLPYGNGQFCATFLLPQNGKSLPDLFEGLNADRWKNLQSSFAGTTVRLGIPTFRLEQEFRLNNTLMKMGMTRAFLPDAQFDKLSKTSALQVSLVKQNTFAAIDEAGAEAAAVTIVGAISSAGSAGIHEFVCDRPFAFIISEKTSGIILFMGRIADPQAL